MKQQCSLLASKAIVNESGTIGGYFQTDQRFIKPYKWDPGSTACDENLFKQLFHTQVQTILSCLPN